MSILKTLKVSQFRYCLALAILLFACSAVLLAQQEDKNAKEKKEEPPKKTSQEKQKGQGEPRRGGPAQNKPSQPAPAQSNPRTSNQPQTGNDQNKGQKTTDQPQSREKQNPDLQNQENRRTERTNQGQQQGQPAAPPQKQEQPNVNRNEMGRGGNQPSGQANTTSRPVPQHGKPGTPAQPQIVRYPNGQPHTVRTADGGMVRRSATGQVVEVHTPGGAVIRHAPTGIRRVEVVRPGNRLVVTSGRNYGYVQRPVVIANRSFVQRTYVSRGVIYTRVYRPVIFGGITLQIYTPVRYYRPAFYAWAYNPWPRPIMYTWGWGAAPWYVFYGGYFVPYPTYVGPIYWLTDYLIADAMASAYQERIDALSAPPPPYAVMPRTELTPEVKQFVADEVRRQIDMERGESQNANSAAYNPDMAPPLFADNSRHTFVVSNALLVNSGLRECTLSEGDVIQTLGVPPMNSPVADVGVLASKPMECRKGSVVSIPLPDLQEMQNYMRETVERGLGELQTRGGQSGLPAPPPNSANTIETPFAAQVHPDNNAAQELTQTEQEANQAEKNVVDQSSVVAGQTGASPATISLGQKIDEVVAIQGQPQKIVDLGNKKIYVYPDLKITFIDGQVADVQ